MFLALGIKVFHREIAQFRATDGTVLGKRVALHASKDGIADGVDGETVALSPAAKALQAYQQD